LEIDSVRTTIEQMELAVSQVATSIPSAGTPLRQRARAAYYLKQWSRAVELLTEAVRNDPADTDLQTLLREALHQLRLEDDYRGICALRDAGHTEAALNAWDDFDRRAPTYPDSEGLREWATRTEL
jgi:tetratricopeptide (TPR) repeat protein